MSEIIVLLIAGFITGILSGIFGIGGGSVMVPILVFLFNFDIKLAIGTSLFLIFPTSITAAYKHYVDGNVDLRLGVIVGLVGFVFTFFGSHLADSISSPILKKLFGLLLILMCIKILALRDSKNNGDRTLLRIALVGAIGGFLSGLLGVGGGGVLVPLLIILLGTSAHVAVGTSLVAIMFNSISGSISNLLLGHVDLNMALILLIGLISGAYIGAGLGDKIQEHDLKIATGIFFGLIGVIMILY